MCTFGSNIAQVVFDVVNTAAGVVSQQKQIKNNNEYRVKVAQNNATIANSEGLRQKQIGINKSRQEKIAGIKEANRLKAVNSASGFDLNSSTAMQNYGDILNLSKIDADITKSQYDTSANSYFQQANSYLSQANLYNEQYNNSVFSNTLNALGKTAKVASNWFDNENNDLYWFKNNRI